MSKPKYMKGDCIRSLDDLVLQENIFWNGRIWNRKWFMNLRNGGYMIDAKEIVQALRCTSTPGGHTSNCEQCPYWKKEQLNGRLKEKLGTDTWTSCDIDKVGLDAADLIERLTAENAALREKVPQWISVEDRLPIDRLSKYLVAFRDTGGSIVDMARYFPSDGWTCDNWEVPQNLITHWMPLPEAPEEGDKADA